MNAVDELNFLLGIGPPRPKLPVTLRKSGYTAVRALGKGSFGQALLVFHEQKRLYYVVKHVNMTNLSARQRKDAYNEISVLQQLDHPNIVRYVDCFEEHPHLYIVMEYADGGDLYTHLNRISTAAGRTRSRHDLLLTEPQVISLFVQTTMALKHMHDRRLLHRDIKSQNVFLTKNHVVKLGDFGITTVLQSTMAMASTMCGTPCYFSPELCQGKPYNNKSDIWALGVLLYELCAGHLPFESTTMKALMREIVHKEPGRIPTPYSDELWRLIQWMLKKDPTQRPDAGQVLRTPILMQQVPAIIAHLQSAEICDIDPQHIRQEGEQSPHGNIADTAPYQQLLARQHEELLTGDIPRFRAVAGVSPFTGVPPPLPDASGYATKEPAIREPVVQLGARKPADPYQLLQMAKNRAKEAVNNAGKSSGAPPPVAPRGLQLPSQRLPATPSAVGNAPAGALLGKHEENNRHGSLKHEMAVRGPPAYSGRDNDLYQKPHLREDDVSPGALAALHQRRELHKKNDSSISSAPVTPARAVSVDNGAPKDTVTAKVVADPLSLPITPTELHKVLKEMTVHFSNFKETIRSSRHIQEEEAALLSGLHRPPETVGAERPSDKIQANANSAVSSSVSTAQTFSVTKASGGVAECGKQEPLRSSHSSCDTFSDPIEAALDIHELAALHDRASQMARLNPLQAPETTFQRSFNKSFHADRARSLYEVGELVQKEPSSGTSAEVEQIPSAGYAASDDFEAGDMDDDVLLYGTCLCGNSKIRGWLSTVYGSFICTCSVCCRASGSSEGVEWLHLPNTEDVRCVVTSSNVSVDAAAEKFPAGAGGTAAVALRPNASEVPGVRLYQITQGLPDHPAQIVGSSDVSGQREGDQSSQLKCISNTLYFCEVCGCKLAMRHNQTDGLLLPMFLLNTESIQALSRYAQTVNLDDTGEYAY